MTEQTNEGLRWKEGVIEPCVMELFNVLIAVMVGGFYTCDNSYRTVHPEKGQF